MQHFIRNCKKPNLAGDCDLNLIFLVGYCKLLQIKDPASMKWFLVILFALYSIHMDPKALHTTFSHSTTDEHIHTLVMAN